MRVPRIYHPLPANTLENSTQPALSVGQQLDLCDEAANHVGRVLRMQDGQPLVLFTGDGMDYRAVIVSASKKNVRVEITDMVVNATESPVKIHLGQGISRGDRMDFVLQKSVELGVHSITPVFTERCGVKLSGDRLQKKVQQWQKIVVAACEQSGRSVVPQVHSPVALNDWLAKLPPALRLTLDPTARKPLREQQLTSEHVQLLIGPEGGLTDTEIAASKNADFQPVQLGPRVLRTETAALTALSVMQYQFGDLATPIIQE
ncbi:16S rRNA (uracil(1498)-N(3))-methyltransferase [Pseudidiomarina terrestris]|uniref:16S rRNA (uracil(1498)-N(3))-methyltransferase n=1 Tax=Pseudidiomarina terrestris TaxID=2820060 RepID=UPI0026517414|nr:MULTISPECIES: 16S rRNA (uracil(1498)-N(3))-methyltransferase [unclassified Pseudidiomarina]MDN7127362.1 16S rRNA (uracil(1498)-N(3))-methyltransferase [Pseudidiomarina sp. 1APR75-33.1]MDN7136148.1 16S rRNA (uracil(1498)-N(3))-methyltransferase [Pseudidiomarina sp. 1ASP75-5]